MTTPANPVPSGSGVWLPMPLAERLFACYYGNGPRLSDPSASAPPEPPPVPPVEHNPMDPPTRGGVPDLQRLSEAVRGVPKGFKPRGIVATPYPSPDSQPPPEGTKP